MMKKPCPKCHTIGKIRDSRPGPGVKWIDCDQPGCENGFVAIAAVPPPPSAPPPEPDFQT